MGNSDKKFQLKLDKRGNILIAVVEGFFQPDDANQFVGEYTKIIAGINAKEFELQFDCKNLKVSSNDMTPMLTACFEMYKKDGFKNIIFDCGTNSTLKLQLGRIARTTGIVSFQIL